MHAERSVYEECVQFRRDIRLGGSPVKVKTKYYATTVFQNEQINIFAIFVERGNHGSSATWTIFKYFALSLAMHRSSFRSLKFVHFFGWVSLLGFSTQTTLVSVDSNDLCRRCRFRTKLCDALDMRNAISRHWTSEWSSNSWVKRSLAKTKLADGGENA